MATLECGTRGKRSRRALRSMGETNGLRNTSLVITFYSISESVLPEKINSMRLYTSLYRIRSENSYIIADSTYKALNTLRTAKKKLIKVALTYRYVRIRVESIINLSLTLESRSFVLIGSSCYK